MMERPTICLCFLCFSLDNNVLRPSCGQARTIYFISPSDCHARSPRGRKMTRGKWNPFFVLQLLFQSTLQPQILTMINCSFGAGRRASETCFPPWQEEREDNFHLTSLSVSCQEGQDRTALSNPSCNFGDQLIWHDPWIIKSVSVRVIQLRESSAYLSSGCLQIVVMSTETVVQGPKSNSCCPVVGKAT